MNSLTNPRPGPNLSADRVAEINEIVTGVTRWAATREDITGLLLVGSCARGAARPDSDVDLTLLTTEPGLYDGEDWARDLGMPTPIRTQRWGVILERRFATPSGLEVEFGIGSPSWADIDPIDPGTRRVVTDGARSLHDPVGMLATLIAACRPS